jgi:hypothetical protein
MIVSERCPPASAGLPKACCSAGDRSAKARVSDPINKKFAGAPGSVSAAVLTLMRGIESILRSMKTLTPTTPISTSGSATASASANRRSTTRTNGRAATRPELTGNRSYRRAS